MRKVHRDDLTGKIFGRVTVLEYSHKSSSGALYWVGRCTCGNVRPFLAGLLRSGQSQSCGCFHREKVTTHGMTKTRTFKTWDSMRYRCSNPNDPSYSRYGGAGIKVCDRWNDSFKAFLSDMGERPDGMTLDRIDPLKGYGPDNCRWASSKEQSRNKTNSHNVTFNGVTKPLVDWAKELGLQYSTALRRAQAGLPADEILKPPRPKRPNGTGRKRKAP